VDDEASEKGQKKNEARLHGEHDRDPTEILVLWARSIQIKRVAGTIFRKLEVE